MPKDRQVLTIRVPRELHKQIHAATKETPECRSINDFVLRLLRQELRKREQQQEDLIIDN